MSDSDIQAVTGLQAIRQYPALFLGTDKTALHHMVYEVLGNSVEDVLAGTCSEITMTLRADSEICIRDNSTGIPVDVVKEVGQSKLELVLTTAMVSKQTFADVRCPYPIMGGLYGLGLKVTNALSSRFSVDIARAGYLWRQN